MSIVATSLAIENLAIVQVYIVDKMYVKYGNLFINARVWVWDPM